MLILDKDPNFKDEVLKRAMLKIIDADKEENVDRFFDLFRASSPKTIKALYNMSKIFEEEGEVENSLTSTALCTVESFTHILESISERDASFSYTDLASYLQKINEYEDIMLWCSENHFWDNLIFFCRKVALRGNVLYSNATLEVIAKNAPDSYCRAAAIASIIR